MKKKVKLKPEKKRKNYEKNRNYRASDEFMSLLKAAAKMGNTTVTDIVKEGARISAEEIIKRSLAPGKVKRIIDVDPAEEMILPEKEPVAPPEKIKIVNADKVVGNVTRKYIVNCTQCGACHEDDSDVPEIERKCDICNKTTLHKAE
jgi:uncharacterized protein (DUF1778 family)